MKLKKYFKCCFFLFFLAGVLVSCQKLESPHMEFLKGGEIVYTGKAETLQVFAGKNRSKLSWYLVSDPKITKAKVFWNNPANLDDVTPVPGQRNPGKDSVEIAIQRTSGAQLVEIMIDRLVEGVYTFNVYTYDDEGHSSIKTEVIGEVYGESFQNNLFNRPLNVAKYDTVPGHSNVFVEWYGMSEQGVVVDLVYTDVNNIEKTIHVRKIPDPFNPKKGTIWRSIDTLYNHKHGTSFKYRSGYVPEARSIDTFYTAYTVLAANKIVSPPPPPPSVMINVGSTLARKMEKRLVGGKNTNFIVLTPGIKVSDLKDQVSNENPAYSFVYKVYKPGNLTTPRSSGDPVYDGDIIVFYYEDDATNKTEVTAAVYIDLKFVPILATIGTNVTQSGGYTASSDVAYTGSAPFPYIQSANNVAAVGSWVAISTNITKTGNYKVDLVYKGGNRGNIDAYLGSISPANKLGETLNTGTASVPLYLADLIVGNNVAIGHKLSIKTLSTKALAPGLNNFIFSLVSGNGANYQVVLESVQLKLVE